RRRFTGAERVVERKPDGIRTLAFQNGREVRLLSRNRLLQNASYPSFVQAIAALPAAQVILDGEALGVWCKRDEVGYHLFDVLWLDGRDLAPLPLEDRREILAGLPLAPPLVLVGRLDEPAPWERA